MALQYKLDESGTYILRDQQGNPIVITDDDKEFGLDGIDLYTKIPSLQNEAKSGREKVKELQTALKKFDKIKSPEEALKAMKTVQDLKDKELVDAGEVEKLKKRLEEAWDAKFKETKGGYETVITQKDEAIAKAKKDLFDALVTTQFAKSDYFVGPERKTKLTPAIARAYFGDNFKVEEDALGNKVVVGYYSSGEKIVSQKNPLATPSFDEAIGAIIEAHPDKAEILSESAGAGARGGHRSGIVGPKQVRSDDLNTIGQNLEKIASGDLTVVSRS